MAAHYPTGKVPTELTDTELLSVFLTKNNSITPLTQAENIIRESGTLTAAVYKSSRSKNDAKLTAGQAYKIQSGMELGRRIAYEQIASTNAMTSPSAVREFLKLQLGDKEHEIFSVIALNNRHMILDYKELFYGDDSSAACYPREVLKYALSVSASALLLVHCHPSKVNTPSDTDVRLTKKIVEACNYCDLRVLDHVIVAGGTYSSLAELGLM